MATPSIEPLPISAENLKARLDFLDKLEIQFAKDAPWDKFESAAEYRKAKADGINGFPKPNLDPNARTVQFPARDMHQVELRVIQPTSSPSRGTWLHFHGGKNLM